MNSILAKTGTVTTAHRAGDGRYLCEISARADRQLVPITTTTDVDALVGHPWWIFERTPDEKITRKAPEIVNWRQGTAGPIPIHSGIISPEYAARLKTEMVEGKHFFVRKIVGVKTINPASPYRLEYPRGDVRPLTYSTKIRSRELGWTDDLSQAGKIAICGKVIRSALRGQPLRRQTIKTAAGIRKTAPTVAAHNLVFCPNPTALRDIEFRQLPVDLVMEVAARRTLEKFERRNGVTLTAICSTHLEDSSGYRPHLHIRLVAYGSSGKYVPIFDRAYGHAGGNRCVFEQEMQRQFDREIERER